MGNDGSAPRTQLDRERRPATTISSPINLRHQEQCQRVNNTDAGHVLVGVGSIVSAQAIPAAWRYSPQCAALHQLDDLDQILIKGHGAEFAAVKHRENAMRPLITAVFSVATLLSVSSSAFAQGTAPGQNGAGGAPQEGTFVVGTDHTPSIIETGRYHPCPSSVGFGNGRTVCLGLERGPSTYGCGRWCWWYPPGSGFLKH
jgi:hypothetical protein